MRRRISTSLFSPTKTTPPFDPQEEEGGTPLTSMYSHATQRLSVGLLLCAAAVHGFTATLRGGNGRVQSSACSMVALHLARPSRDGNDDGIRKAGGAEAGKKESAPADKMFSSFDAFRGKAIKETEAAERAFLRFDEFLKTDEEKKNGSRQ